MDPFSFLLTQVIQLGISYIFPSEGPRLKDTKITASTYGAAIPWTYGVTRVAGNMIWAEPIKEHKQEKLQGKGGFYNDYEYSCSFAMGFCRGPAMQIRRIWADGKIIMDSTGNSELYVAPRINLRHYFGDESQLPDSLIEANKGVGNAPAYRGLCYTVFDNFPLKNYGNRIPQITAEVFAQADGGGAAPRTQLTTHQGDPISGNFASFTVDPDRGFAYVQRGETILRFRMSDGVQDLTITNEMMAFPDTTDYTSPGGIKRDNQLLSAILAVSPTTGALMVQHGFNNNVAIDILDPTTYASIAFGGSSDPFGSTLYGGPFGPVSGAGTLSTTASGAEWVIFRDLFGQVYKVPFVISSPALQGPDAGTTGETAGSTVLSGLLIGADGFDAPTYFICEGGRGDGGLTTHLTIRSSGNLTGADAVIENPITPGVPTLSFGIGPCLWDDADPGIVVLFGAYSSAFAAKYDYATDSIKWVKQVPGAYINGARAGSISNSQLAVLVQLDGGLDPHSALYILDTREGRWVTQQAPKPRTSDPYDAASNDVLDNDQATYTGIPMQNTSISSQSQFYDPTRNAIVTVGSGGAWSIVKVAPGIEETSLGWITESVLRAGGLSAVNIDMSRLYATPVLGYGWGRSTDIKSVLDELRRVYLFDIVESQGKLVGIPRGVGQNGDGSTAATIEQNVLGSSAPEAVDFWQQTRIQEADLPARVTLAYMNYDNDYEASVAMSTRVSNPLPTMFSRQQVAMQVSVVMHAQEAKDRMNAALYTQWAERVKYDTRLPWAYLALDPADLVTVDMNDGRSFFNRLDSTEIGADYTIASHFYSQDSGAYVSNAARADGGGTGAKTIVTPQVAKAFVANTPLLLDSDDTGGSFSRYYAGLGNAGSGAWSGAEMYRATNDVDYFDLFGVDAQVEWGAVQGVVPSASHGNFALDWETEIIVWPASADFDLSPITDDELWSGGNPCLIGQEIIQFRDCVANADGSWTLSNLLRGRRGTEYACDSHKAGESFLFLDQHTIVSQGDTIDSRGQARNFKAVGRGRPLPTAPVLTVVYEPRDMMPYAPVDIRRALMGGNSVEIVWSRRTRMGGNMQDFTGTVPLNETNETYEVYFLDAPFAGDLSRGNAPDSWLFKATTKDTELTWTPSSTAEFDVNLDTLHVVIYQLSSAVGRGFPGTRSIEPWQDF